MKALTWISVVVCIIYGAIVFAIYEKTRTDALEQSRNLQQVEATVQRTERCRGKSLCYFTIAEYQIDGKVVKARVAGEIGKNGTTFTLLVIPGSDKGFLSHAAYIEQVTAFLPFLFFPLAVFFFPLILSVVKKYEKHEHPATQGKRPA
ncbi:hypothetical protein EDC30_1252 [Paucimonas lemoignei]|uniref:DUF3592 domain-containing protein n=1 Tax=Paucimonas lemoignei TaxID=29443 RepID=A0A4R3HQH7_PAULE|nr:hypothetical protein [Paucimonas lemoignei]TCS32064.1 hypothetical protein EDC30_1252 [Paucimonas lemoignei]